MALPQVSNPKISIFWKIQILWFTTLTILWIGFFFFSPLDLDYSSGELWDHFLAWRDGNPLYSPINASPYRVLNYSPLFFGLTSLFTQTGLSPLSAGRLLNSLAFFFSLTVLFCWLRKKSLSSWRALAILSLSATSLPILYSTGQFHLEMPAVSLSLLGLFLLDRSEKTTTLYLGGICLALACLTKQTQVLSALVGLFWLLRYRSKNGLILGALLAGLGGLTALLLTSWFTPEIWRHLILYTVGTYSFSGLVRQSAYHLLPWLLFFLFGLWLGFKNKEKRRELSWWYFSGSSLGLLSTARMGSGSQYFIEWSFATLLWIGPGLIELLSKFSLPKNRKWALLILIQILAADIGVGGVLLYDLKTLRHQAGLLPALCSEIEPHTILPAEDVGALRACGAKPALHPFIMTNLARRGLWDETPFLQQIISKNYPLLLLPFDPREGLHGVHADRWNEKTIQTILDNYRITETIGDWRVLKPISPSSPSPLIPLSKGRGGI